MADNNVDNNAALICDGNYWNHIEKEYALDIMKAVAYIQIKAKVVIKDRYWFDSSMRTNRTNFLRAAYGPCFVVKEYKLKPKQCPKCNQFFQVQAGCDVGIALRIFKLALENRTIVLLTGDGDFEEALEYAKETAKCHIIVWGIKKSSSTKLHPYASEVYFFDDANNIVELNSLLPNLAANNYVTSPNLALEKGNLVIGGQQCKIKKNKEKQSSNTQSVSSPPSLEDNASCCEVYLGNVPLEMRNEDTLKMVLRNAFGPTQEVVVRDPKVFVMFTNKQSAVSALEKGEVLIGGQTCKIQSFKEDYGKEIGFKSVYSTPASFDDQSSYRTFHSNLSDVPPENRNEDIIKLVLEDSFGPTNEITFCDLNMFVTFTNKETVDTVLEKGKFIIRGHICPIKEL